MTKIDFENIMQILYANDILNKSSQKGRERERTEMRVWEHSKRTEQYVRIGYECDFL